jgi:hypothetical protein
VEEKRQKGLWRDRLARVTERLKSRARKRGKRNALWMKRYTNPAQRLNQREKERQEERPLEKSKSAAS